MPLLIFSVAILCAFNPLRVNIDDLYTSLPEMSCKTILASDLLDDSSS